MIYLSLSQTERAQSGGDVLVLLQLRPDLLRTYH